MTTLPFLSSATTHEVGSILVQFESDVIRARNLANLLAQETNFDKTTCIRIGTAVSELCRNIIEHATTGSIEFKIAERKKESSGIVIVFKDKGGGIKDLTTIQSGNYKSKNGMGVGLLGSQRLMDDFDIHTIPKRGTTITIAKWLPRFAEKITTNQIADIKSAFQKTIERGDSSMVDTINAQNKELGFLLKKLQERNDEIETINQELEETNKGVVALNRELEDKAIDFEKAKMEAVQASKAKSDFLANMSHEIRTPMNAILGFAEMLESKIEDDQLKNYASAISSSGGSLLSIINDILDLSKIEAGKTEINYRPISLKSVVREVVQVFKHKTDRKNIDFLVEMDNDVPTSIILDDVRLRQILINLIGNAIKFTEKGSVSLIIQKGAASDNNTHSIHFMVKDTGIGIPKDQQEHIFGAFEQQKNQSINKYGGTGLGLTITKRLTDMMNGKIWVESEPGQGSTFHVVLKEVELSEKPHPCEDKNKNVQIIFEPAHVLVADDIHINRKLIQTVLKNTNLELTLVENGQEAVNATKTLGPDLILMDLKMPEMDGFEATSMIKSDDKLKQIPVLAFTASALKEEKEKILASEFDGYLQKPISRKHIFKELAKFLPHKTEEEIEQENKETEPKSSDIKAGKCSPDFFEALNKQLHPKWQTVRDTFILGEISGLAEQALSIGEQYNAVQLVKWGKEVQNQVVNLDMEHLPGTMQGFEHLWQAYNKQVS